MIGQDIEFFEDRVSVTPFDYPESAGTFPFQPAFSSEPFGIPGAIEAEWSAKFKEVFPGASTRTGDHDGSSANLAGGRLERSASSPRSAASSQGVPSQARAEKDWPEQDRADQDRADQDRPEQDGASQGWASQGRASQGWAESAEEITALVEQERAQAESRGRKDGFNLGLSSARKQAAEQLEAERSRSTAQVASLIEAFTREREEFLESLEEEAAALALAVAARILRRESAADPLLLLGAVRIALGQLAESSQVRLRVSAEDEAIWSESLATVPNLIFRPRVVSDRAMQPGELRIETDLGTADLGLNAQLQQIEQSFFSSRAERGKDSFSS